MKRIQMAVRDFALPVPRIGSIEVHSGYNLLPQGGDEVHREAQRVRLLSIPNYKSEVKLSHSFEHKDFLFVVSGRADGLFESEEIGGKKKSNKKDKHSGNIITIEEIKTAFDAAELYEKLRSEPSHPYCLQLQTYAYIYQLQNDRMPCLSFHIVSYADGRSYDLSLEFDIAKYETWLDKRLDELVVEAKLRAEEKQRRERLGKSLRFPFSKPRTGQVELIDTIERTMPTGDFLLIQAPTGLGKTAGVIFPVLKDSLSRGQKLIYVTPKNSQHHVAQDAIKRMQNDGHAVRALTLTAKSKICFKGEPVCNPEHCEFARDYYAKMYKHDLAAKAAEHTNMDGDLFKALGEQYEVCPFELSLDSIQYADIVVGDYNYAFSPRRLTGRFTDGGTDSSEKPNLVVDEAHNLPDRAVDYFSPAISSSAISACKERIEALPIDLRLEGEALLHKCKAVLRKYEPKTPKPVKLDLPTKPFADLDEKLSQYIGRYLRNILTPKPGDAIIGFCRQWTEFTQMLARINEVQLPPKETSDGASPQPARFFITSSTEGNHVTLKITCCDASEELAECLKDFEQVVAFSATLKPFEYYRQLCGFREDRVQTVEFASPFPKDRRKLLVIPQVSTKYSDRNKNASKIAQAIERIIQVKPGNYFVFFPSFAFLRQVFELVSLPGFRLLRQEPGMAAAQAQKYIDYLKAADEPTIIFAVQGGIFSEGVDYPGDMLIGALIVGPALPGFDLERELVREYYESKFGNGFDYAYTYPAMARVVQAAGRVIRSEQDAGLIVLMDRRFTLPTYTDTMPADWFSSSVNDLVSSSIINDIESFWRGLGNK